MPTISPSVSIQQINGRSTPVVTWADIATADTVNPFAIAGSSPAFGAVQLSGTFGGTTVTLGMSNDNVTFAAIPKDIHGNTLSTSAAGIFDFQTSALYLKPVLTGGSGNAVDVTLVLRSGG